MSDKTRAIRGKSLSSQSDRYEGLDSLRFVAAVFVVMGHGAIPPLTAGHDPSDFWAKALNGVWTGSVSGPAAVIVFFVISGFCIHLPYHKGKPMNMAEFWTRRGVRIIIPMVAALLLARMVNGWQFSAHPLAGIPAWSLVCELIYYGLYPFMLRVRDRWGLGRQFAIAFGLALLLAFTKPIDNVNYPAWGIGLDWILGLPCWMLGLVLAERVDRFSTNVSSATLWIFRGSAFLLGAITHNLALQRIVGQHLTLNFFAIFAYAWIGAELTWFRRFRPSRILEWAGTWSYSLYLVHGSASVLLDGIHVPNLGFVANWMITMGWVLGMAYGFYVMVEAPSHSLARHLGRVAARPKIAEAVAS